MKPTWGRVSCYGVFPLAETLDHVGPMARSVEDAALLYDVIAEPDRNCRAMPELHHGGERPVPGGDRDVCRIGVDVGLVEHIADDEVNWLFREALDALREMNFTIVDISLPDTDRALGAFGTILTAEAATAHRALFARHGADYGPVLRGVIEAGMAVSGMDYVEAMRVRQAHRAQYSALFSTIDILMLPVAPTATPTNAAFAASMLEPDGGVRGSYFSAPLNLAGLPSLTVPMGFTANDMPLGIQFAGPWMAEKQLFDLGRRFQRHPVGSRVPDALKSRIAG